ncbi:macro domain-containing protein [Xanthomonas arboricola]|uniref:macro domain-containing protein n=1 Tax=Xanthomonas arboricola TaxID=56448 RepID=UPI0009C03F44|nr:macro domain-containing protein [Xanthomonas arboricola]
MLSYLRTSILKSDAQTVVNTVNTVGVMGKGLAAEYRRLYPEMFERYREICSNQLLEIGKLWLWKGPTQWVLNFPTKTHWRQPSKIAYVEAGLKKFSQTFEERGVTEVAFPRLGCGNGGLDWDEIRPMMEKYLKPLPIPVYIHDHEVELGDPEHVEVKRGVTRANSFDHLWDDIVRLLADHGREFQTIFNRADFKALLNEDSLLIIRGENEKSISIARNELREVWSILENGILTRKKTGW